MADTTFTTGVTRITAEWLNDLNDLFYSGVIDKVKAGTGGTDYSLASFLSRKAVTVHANYGFLDNSLVTPPGGTFGHASFNSNITTAGSAAADHLHSFQSYPHYGTAATLGVLASFFSQMDCTAGTVTEASGLKVMNPEGAGAITTLYGVKVEALTRGSSNWGVHVTGPTANFFGGPVWFGSVTTGYAYIQYSSDLGHLMLVPRATFGVKIGAGAGDRILRFGEVENDTSDATIENAADGHFKITPRSTFRIKSMSVHEMAAPVILPTYTVAGVPSAVDNARGMIYVSNESGGAVPAFSDGTNWRRVTDRAIIS